MKKDNARERDEAEGSPTDQGDALEVHQQEPSMLDRLGLGGDGNRSAKRDALGGEELAVIDPAAAALMSQMESMVKARFAMAVARPRDRDTARMLMERECRRPGFAEVARYDLEKHSRGSGPSARFAEMAARSWGNMDCGSLVVSDTEKQRRIYCYCTDLETNWTEHEMLVVARTVERNPNRVRGRKVLEEREKPSGGTVAIVVASDEEMDAKCKNYVSRTLRVLRLRNVPGDIIDDCMAIVVATQRDAQREDPDRYKKAILRGFAAVNVTPDDLRDYLGKHVDKATERELRELKAVGVRIRDEDYTWDDALAAKRELRDAGDVSATAKEGSAILAAQQRAAKSKAKPEPDMPEKRTDADDDQQAK